MELIGRRFGHIRVVDVVGAGGMGEIYAGFDETLQRKVALKALHADQRLNGESRERLLREARALSKLDHPNICRIYDYIESGEVDVLVLEYIEGQTLHDALNAGISYNEKLRIATAVAEVLVAAHRVDIIHRDLKPENVMLTKSGEVKVLDFGLARWLAGRRSTGPVVTEPAQLQVKEALLDQWYALEDLQTTAILSADERNAPHARRFMVTGAGVTMGTPIYMSPEQARGEMLTTASDMFSFGLLLQTLFTGAEPYPEESTAHEVMVRAGRGDSLPIEGVPHDVKALISRLKQVAPSDRPTAVEALGRLHWVLARPARIMRYSVIAAIVTVTFVGAWRYTVDLQRERAAAVAARHEAERRRAQAEDLIGFMVGDLRGKLEAVSRLDVLNDVGQKTLAYINDVQPERMSVPELARNAKALSQLGEVRLGQGQTPEALPLFKKSQELARLAVQRAPGDAPSRLALGQSHFWLGNSFWLQNKVPDALRHMREYLTISEALARDFPSNREYQLERAYGHSSVGMMVEAEGDIESALAHYRTSMEIKQEQADRSPDDLKARAELARAINKVGAALYKVGDLRGALAYAEREAAAYRLLVQREPQQVQWKQRLASSMGFLARALADTGQTDPAYALWREELRSEEELMEYDRDNVERQRNVAVTTRRVAGVLAQRNDLAAALPLFRRAESLLREARRKAPTQKYLQVDLASLNVEFARALDASGDSTRAQQMFREAARAMTPLAPSDPTARVALARSMFFLGESLARTGQKAAAAGAWASAEQELAPLVAKKTADPPNFDLWTRILARRSRLYEAKAVRERLSRAGYEPTDLESFCSRAGC